MTNKLFGKLSAGKERKTILNELKSAGTYELEFKANELASGIYFCSMQAREFSETKKLILLK